MMLNEKYFKEQDSIKIWDQFSKRLSRILKPLDEEQKNEVIMEIQSHLLDSFNSLKGNNESTRLLKAINNLGEPEDFLKPIIADRLLSKAARTFKPGTTIRGFYYYLFCKTKKVALTFLFSFGYFLTIGLALVAFLKPVFPKHVGFFILRGGGFIFGVMIDPENAVAELFGYWFIPLCLFLSGFIYIMFTRRLSFLLESKNK